MNKIATELKDCFILEPSRFGDDRGYFSPFYIEKEFSPLGFQGVKQANRSKSAKGVLRGLHFQTGSYAQAKIVEVLNGAAVDVVVDIRPDSATYSQHTTVLLTADNNRQLFVPRGFAHGFVSLTDNTIFQYLVDNDYAPDHEAGILWNDPRLAINWQAIFIEYGINQPQLSEKDTKHPTLSEFREANL